MKMYLAVALCLASGPMMASQVTPIADLQVGTTVTMSGVVERIMDEDEFRLKDASGAVLVYIGPQIVPFDLGDQLTVNGIVDREVGRLEVYARSATRSDGTVFTFDHQYD